MSKFFEYSQNDSGGIFDFDEKTGITHYVVIEADNADDANSRAEKIGLYFYGCDSGQDCPCCGDRWSSVWADDNGTVKPELYGAPVDKQTDLYTWMKPGKEIAVHYKNGKIKWFG